MSPILLPHIFVSSIRPPRRGHVYGTNLLYLVVSALWRRCPWRLAPLRWHAATSAPQSSLSLQAQSSAPSAQHLVHCLDRKHIPATNACICVSMALHFPRIACRLDEVGLGDVLSVATDGLASADGSED